jgi:hypothetical protein
MTWALGMFPHDSDRDRAEGFRQLAHMIVEGLRWEFDHGDAQFPSLMVSNTDTTGWGGPNVDNKYLRAKINGQSTYLWSRATTARTVKSGSWLLTRTPVREAQ